MLNLAPTLGEAHIFFVTELQFNLVQISLVALIVISRSLSNSVTVIFGPQ